MNLIIDYNLLRPYQFLSKLNEEARLIKIFINEIYFKPPKKNYPTNKIVVKHVDQIWSIDLLDMSDYSIKNNNGI